MVDRLVDAGCVWWTTSGADAAVDHRPRATAGRRPVPVRHRPSTGRRSPCSRIAAERSPGVDRPAGRRRRRVAHRARPRSTASRTSPACAPATATCSTPTSWSTRWDGGARSPTGSTRSARARPQVESEEHGFVYYTRYFSGDEPPAMIGPPLAPMGTFSLLTLPGDNGTWSVTIWAAAADTVLRKVRDPDALRQGAAGVPVARALARRATDHRGARDGLDPRQVPTLRRRRPDRSPPGSPPSATRGRARTRRPAAASASGSSTRSACGTRRAPGSTTPRRSSARSTS